MTDHVMIVGSGVMGSGIGAMAALAGHKTVLVDVDERAAAAGVERAAECVKLRFENGLNSEEEALRASSLLCAGASLEEAARGAFLVIEAINEDIAAKQRMFARLDELLPAQTPICSNTSGLRITEISALCERPERTLTTHFWLPAHLIPLVEVVMGDKTDPTVAESVAAELKKWKKTPVLVRRDLPGQLANRVFQAIIREAIAIVESGLASAEDVDAAISCGMAMRMPVWGPLKHLDAVGLELGLSVQDSVLPEICSDKQASGYLRALVERGSLGASTGGGFYDWSQRSIEDDIAKRDEFIIQAVKLVEKQSGG